MYTNCGVSYSFIWHVAIVVSGTDSTAIRTANFPEGDAQ